VSNDNGFFEFNAVEPGTYLVTISAKGFANWTSPALIVKPEQYAILTGSKLNIEEAITTITVVSQIAPREEIAAEEVKIEEQQRIFGFTPNFYVSYNRDAVPLTTKLKFKLAAKVASDPITFIGVGIAAGAEQAGNNLNYPQGAKGYAGRYGAAYAIGFTDIMIGGAILPSLLHQDPRYFYQGTGTNKSRALHALTSPFVCRGDSGKRQPNYSTIGGDLASAAISNAYYPASNRGPWSVFGKLPYRHRPARSRQLSTGISPAPRHPQSQESKLAIVAAGSRTDRSNTSVQRLLRFSETRGSRTKVSICRY
jgi:hypothetical protein